MDKVVSAIQIENKQDYSIYRIEMFPNGDIEIPNNPDILKYYINIKPLP